ncbi:hypothetical protein BJI67_15460 [Acidihalobacter aeolianus]|uniref:PilY1 beta-propeller domain-containing protein n=2 Tax=Acidihalobacter aeolianus TaxID=2792603 RepID=A0A1D8KBD2_9GAMM|nr:hypothetical protein BJI67_15460 [Acidihalobacter aeolianus]
MQNFANWYQYYRSHILMARAGASIAFMKLPTNFRVDFGTISQMSSSSNPEFNTTEPFLLSNGNRSGFLKRFFQQPIGQGYTPLRQALAGVGQWISKQPGSSAPWGTSNAEQAANNHANYLTCRANYTVLVTDGTWNGNKPSVGNADGTQGPLITGSNGQQYQYNPVNPYQDSVSDTLADVAMYYWEQDLQPKMINDVPTNGEDPAFWQHMVTFTIGLGVTPTLVQNYITQYYNKNGVVLTESQAQAAVYAELQNGSASWPTPSPNANANIDDLWHAGIDGHGAFLSAQNPQQFATALANTLYQIVARTGSGSSVATNTQKAGQIQTGTQVYQALYHPLNWWGELLAEPILIDPTSNQPYVSTVANWDASCVLTGGACPAMGTTTQGQATNTLTAQSPSSRVILTDSGTQGVAFEWSDLSSAEQTLLNGADNLGQERLDYLRGTRSAEESQGGTLRNRTGLLGDIVHSSPVWVGYPLQSYPSTPGQPVTWKDDLYPTANQAENSSSAQTFDQFEQANETRTNVVYVGANDGMLHGFRAGSYTVSSTGQYVYNNTDNDGKEVLAFVPQSVYDNINQFTDPQYNHHYYVDATPGTGDVFYGGSWHTWLASGLGAGGKELFVLDINNPANFSEANAASIVKADWTTSNLTCVNDSNCAQDLGYTFGTPQIRRFHNGDWGVIWGNGYNSTNGEAGIFIGLIDPSSSTGTMSVYWISTGYGPSNDPTAQSRPDGIGYVTAADLDGDHITDYVYAGDLFGNVWRFNLTSSNPADWHVSTYGNSTGTPLFSAVNSAGTPQPITTKIQVISIPSGLPSPEPQNRLMVEFGTGQLLDSVPNDSVPNTTSTGVQSIYGIWDWDMSNWDNGYTTSSNINVPASSTLYAYLSSPPTINRNSLQQQTITNQTFSTNSVGVQVGLRQTSNTSVSWADLTYNGTPGTQYGWYLDLVYNSTYQGEMVIYNPTIQNGVFLFNTTILGQQGLTCGVNNNGGWSMALDPSDGAMLEFNAFSVNNIADYIGAFDASTLQGIFSGITVGAVGSPAFVTYGGKTYMLVSTNSGHTKLIQTGLGGNGTNVRISWRELR